MPELGPRSRRIYEVLAQRIRSGALAPGAQLPSHRELAADFSVAPMTVRQVLGMLESAGLVSRQAGRGTFVRPPGRLTLLVVVLLLCIVLGSVLSPYFLPGFNFYALTSNGMEIAIMALPMTLIVIVGEIDLSVASVLGLASVVLGLIWQNTQSMWPGIAVALQERVLWRWPQE